MRDLSNLFKVFTADYYKKNLGIVYCRAFLVVGLKNRKQGGQYKI